MFYEKGMEYDLFRHGFDIKRNQKVVESREELEKIYYTEQELKEIEKAKKQLKENN